MPIAEVLTEMLDAPTMSRILKLAVAKYKGRLHVNVSGAGSVTMQEVAEIADCVNMCICKGDDWFSMNELESLC